MLETVIITDTSCLIALSKLDLLESLDKIYQDIRITPEIESEFGEPLPEFIKISEPKDKKYQKILETILDKGEASAISLAFEYDNVLLVLDDLKGRKEAQKIGFKITGTLGILTKAKQLGVIDKIRPFIEELKNLGFRISDKVEQELYRQNKEL